MHHARLTLFPQRTGRGHRHHAATRMFRASGVRTRRAGARARARTRAIALSSGRGSPTECYEQTNQQGTNQSLHPARSFLGGRQSRGLMPHHRSGAAEPESRSHLLVCAHVRRLVSSGRRKPLHAKRAPALRTSQTRSSHLLYYTQRGTTEHSTSHVRVRAGERR